MRRRRATVPLATSGDGREAARSGEWAQHFSNASCSVSLISTMLEIIYCRLTVEKLWYKNCDRGSVHKSRLKGPVSNRK